MLRDKLINYVIDVMEGGYSNDPSDSGGETMYGITAVEAKANGYTGEMKDLPREFAFNIYVNRYWNSIMGDKLVEISERIAEEVFDTGVNCGVNTSVKFLQRVVNALNNVEKLYSNIRPDGIMGENTLEALKKCLTFRKEDVILKGLNCLQGAYYINLVEVKEKNEKFLNGWLDKRVNIGGQNE